MIEILLFTLAGVALYFGADRVLDWIERRRGQRFEYRQVIYFVLILGMALVLFQILEHLGHGLGGG